ncbi:MAG: creatininase family protein [Bryobacterales bacterium]|nr:creatininase family protein [Bryobacterales bacterium]
MSRRAVEGDTFIRYVTGIGKSLAHHGFRKILLVNGQGNNVPFLDIVARNITNAAPSICAMVPWWNLLSKALLPEIRESEFPGGMARGCELETSVIPYVRGDQVRIDKAQKDIHFGKSEDIYWFSRYSKTGTARRSHEGGPREGAAGDEGGNRQSDRPDSRVPRARDSSARGSPPRRRHLRRVGYLMPSCSR